ncbi:MAG: galactose oxidase-like domain-containing protein [Pirellulaceae bacterium]
MRSFLPKKHRRVSIRSRLLHFETLESRQLLATIASFDNDRVSATYAAGKDASDPPPAELAGGVIPGAKSEFIRVYSGVANNLNSIAFARTDVGAPGSVLADFDFRMTPVNERPDGLSFSLVNTAYYEVSGTVVAAGSFPQYYGSLGIAFDTFKHDGDPSGDSVKVYYNTQLITQVDVSTTLDLAGGQWIHARVSLIGDKLSLQFTPAAGGTMTVLSDLTLPDFIPFESRVVFSGWSGGAAWGTADVDNVNVQYATTGKAILSFKPVTTTIDETAGTVKLIVERSGDLTKSVFVRYAPQAVTALANQDFVALSGTVSFAIGEKSKTISFPIVNDPYNEPHEQFVVTLSSPSNGAIIAGPDRRVVTIVDDERGRVLGDFGDVLPLPNEMIHAILLPTGEVLSVDQETGHHTAWLWNPQTGQSRKTSPPPEGSNLFCSGHTLLADGRVFFAGGHEGFDESGNPRGICTVSIYNPWNNTWETLPELEECRWYPTVLVLPSGDVLVVGGFDESGTNTIVRQIEIYRQEAGIWTRRNLDVSQDQAENDAAHDGYLYERMYLAPSGRVFVLGAGSQSWWLNLAAEGTDAVWTPGPATIGTYTRNDYGTATMTEPGKIVLIGGGGAYEGLAPQASVEIIDLNVASPQWRALDPLPGGGRRHLNTTVLPGGDLLVTGGTRSGDFNIAAGDARTALRLKPTAAPGLQWETWDSAASPRLYHSTALLLPSGKVLTAGSGQPHAADSWDQRNAEVFSPTYIYQTGRPVISSAPATGNYSQIVNVKVSTNTLSQVVLMKLGAITHSLEENARRVPLTWTRSGTGSINVSLPSNSNAAPPGHYLLFVLDSRGVPSEGRMLQILSPAPPPSGGSQGGGIIVAGEEDLPSSPRRSAPIAQAVKTAALQSFPVDRTNLERRDDVSAKKPALSEPLVDQFMAQYQSRSESTMFNPRRVLGTKTARR